MIAKREVGASVAGSSGKALRLAIWLAVASLLLLPLIAMQFTREVAWTGFDFAAATVLLVGGASAYELVVRRFRDRRRRAMFGALIVAIVLLLWVQGAVGIL